MHRLHLIVSVVAVPAALLLLLAGCERNGIERDRPMATVNPEPRQRAAPQEASRPQLDQAELKERASAVGYLQAHRDLKDPQPLLGGPITVRVTQDSGGVHVALPDRRELDQRIFGTPEMPLSYGGSPIITGVSAPVARGPRRRVHRAEAALAIW